MRNCCVLQDCVGCWSVNCFELSDIEDDFFCKLDQSENNINGEKTSEDIDSLFLPSNDGKCNVNLFCFLKMSRIYIETSKHAVTTRKWMKFSLLQRFDSFRKVCFRLLFSF